jgi:hypothetical protein
MHIKTLSLVVAYYGLRGAMKFQGRRVMVYLQEHTSYGKYDSEIQIFASWMLPRQNRLLKHIGLSALQNGLR